MPRIVNSWRSEPCLYSLKMLVGIDHYMNIGRAVTNFIGNAVATVECTITPAKSISVSVLEKDF